MGKLDGKVAAITGGTRSIGRGIADAFARQGASVVVNGRDEVKGKACLEEMGAGDRAAFFAGDATKQETVEGLVDFAVDRYGQLDIMVRRFPTNTEPPNTRVCITSPSKETRSQLDVSAGWAN